MSNEFTNQEICMILIGLGFFILISYINLFYFEKIANEKAQNPDNLIAGCMYYERLHRDKHDFVYISFNIDRKYYSNTLKSTPTPFYDYVRNIGFDNFEEFKNFISSNGRDVCYQVSYIKLDYIVFKRIFIYQYHGINYNIDKSSQPTER